MMSDIGAQATLAAWISYGQLVQGIMIVVGGNDVREGFRDH